MMEVGPPPKQPVGSTGAAAAPARASANAIPVELIQPPALPKGMAPNATLPALVEPGGKAGVTGELLLLRTDQGLLTIQSPVSLAAGTRVNLQLATIAGRTQLLLVPPRPSPDSKNAPLGKAAIIATAAKPSLETLEPGSTVRATIVRAAARGGESATPLPADENAASAAEAGNEALPANPEAVENAAPGAAPPAIDEVAPAAQQATAPPPAPASSEPTLQAASSGDATSPAAALRSAAPVPSPEVASGAPAAANQAFSGMAPGQQVTLTILSVSAKPPAEPPAASTVESSLAAAKDAQAASDVPQSIVTKPGPNAAALAFPRGIAAAPAAAQAANPLAAASGSPTQPAASAAPAPAAQASASAPEAAAPAGGTGPAAGMAEASDPASPAARADAGTITISAEVVGSDAAGQPILQTGSVLLVLEAKSPPLGSAVELALPRTGASAPSTPAAAAAGFAPLEEIGREAAAQGGALQQAVTALMPRPGPALAAQLALYVGALRQGSLSSWLGPAASDQLEKLGRSRAAQRLGSAFAELAQAMSGGDRAQGWLSLTLPVLEAGVIQPIQLYVQRRKDEEEKPGDAPQPDQGRRFLIDFTLTKLGSIQLDGLARDGKLDLIVRTSKPMATELRGSIDRLFADVTSARGLSASLLFQVAPPLAPVRRDPAQRQTLGGIVV